MAHGPWTHNTLYEMTLHGKAANQDVVNSHKFEVTTAREDLLTSDALAQVQAGTIADDWITNLRTLWLACLPTAYTLVSVTCRFLERPGNINHRGSPIERTQAGPPAGTAGPGIHDLTSCGVIRWRTPVAGKSHRARSYLGPMLQDWASGGALIGGGPAALAAYADALIARYPVGTTNAGGSQLTVYSRPYDFERYTRSVLGVLTVQTKTDYDGNSTLITGRQVDTVLRVQRRRELGVGS